MRHLVVSLSLRQMMHDYGQRAEKGESAQVLTSCEGGGGWPSLSCENSCETAGSGLLTSTAQAHCRHTLMVRKWMRDIPTILRGPPPVSVFFAAKRPA